MIKHLRSIHRFDKITGALLVALLIATQVLSPLIHGHGGYEEPIRGFHLPGFENLSRTSDRMDIGSDHGFQYAGLELIITVASGIEQDYPDASDFDDHDPSAFIHSFFGDNRRDAPVAYRHVPTVALPVIRGWLRQPGRAPPRF